MIPQRGSKTWRLLPVGSLVAGLSIAVGGVGAGAEASNRDAKRPALSLKAHPAISFAPTTIALTAELKGGPDDSEEFYCAAVEWDWGDDTKSEFSFDCEPYVAGTSAIRRRFTTDHRYSLPGSYRVSIRLRKNKKVVASAQANVQVRPGLSVYE